MALLEIVRFEIQPDGQAEVDNGPTGRNQQPGDVQQVRPTREA